jgi:hypothetical protein
MKEQQKYTILVEMNEIYLIELIFLNLLVSELEAALFEQIAI